MYVGGQPEANRQFSSPIFFRRALVKAKGLGIKDVAFARRKGLSVLEMAKSRWVYKQLRNFRAGIEANISRLKRSFGLSCCDWTG